MKQIGFVVAVLGLSLSWSMANACSCSKQHKAAVENTKADKSAPTAMSKASSPKQ